MTTETIEYREGPLTMRGYLSYDESLPGKRPGVLVAHDAMGLSGDPQRRADMLAKLGYVALAIDMYSAGKIPKDSPEAMSLLMALINDRTEMRRRVGAALHTLIGRTNVDASKIAAIGYCFGGTTVLELARSGAAVKGVVSFHGGLASPSPADAKNAKGKILVCHGNDDPLVPPAQVADFIQEMHDGGCDWQLIQYGNTVHGFTNPKADGRTNPAIKYNESSDKRSWKAMQDFFDEIFAG